jgi:hypothetical protein
MAKISTTRIVMLAFSMLFFACEKEEEGLTEEKRQRILLSRGWVIASVVLGGEDVTDLGFTQMELTFQENGTWESTNGLTIFGPSGTYTLGADVNQLNMSGLPITLSIKDQAAQMKLTFVKSSPTPISGRKKTVTGFYELTFLPKFNPLGQ